jgi:quinoprotein dehydrogenase-associated probable ABC transporter substrate-binding protein
VEALMIPTAFVTLGLVLATGQSVTSRELRVCADPNNLPFSNRQFEGFENRIAAIIAKDMNATLTYAWMPQRRGFVRRTLKAGLCDLIIDLPAGYETVLSTKPYYRSTYVFVYRRDRHLDVRSFDDSRLRGLKIGLHMAGEDGANQPPAHALARRHIVDNIVAFKMWDVDSVESPPGRIIDAVADGAIDIAIVWGPFAGYFASRQHTELQIVPVQPSIDPPSLPFAYDISMAVRPGQAAFKEEIEGILDRRRADIAEILAEYGVPLVGPRASSQP